MALPVHFLALSNIFNEHSAQCVIREFATQDYRNFPGVEFFDHSTPLMILTNKPDRPCPIHHFHRFLAENENGEMQVVSKCNEEVA